MRPTKFPTRMEVEMAGMNDECQRPDKPCDEQSEFTLALLVDGFARPHQQGLDIIHRLIDRVDDPEGFNCAHSQTHRASPGCWPASAVSQLVRRGWCNCPRFAGIESDPLYLLSIGLLSIGRTARSSGRRQDDGKPECRAIRYA